VADSTPTAALPERDESTEIVQPQSRRRGIVVAVVVVLVLVSAGLWWRSTFSEDTDDAQINGHLIQVSARIAGLRWPAPRPMPPRRRSTCRSSR
jgi:membrane fusion protein (multidrug efflux system)